MKRKNFSRLWIYFALIVLSIMLATAIIMSSGAYLLYKTGHLNPTGGNPLIPIIFLLLLSMMIGTVISLFVAKKILNPITRFSKAADEVAKGNFNIRMDETERIEEIRDLTRKFNMMVQELSSIETLRNDFVVNVSHEFKTPIASIEGYAMLLQDGSLSDDERNEYAQMIIDSSRQLSTLSHNILSLSKLENQEIILEKESYRFDEQIRQAVLMLEPEWSSKDLDLQIDLMKTNYYGNENLLMQVWLNMIGNAIKFTPHGGKIGVRLFEREKCLLVKISDTGIGIDDSIKKHIFDKFYQGDAARKVDGNGLGLALAKRIIDLCNGNITVESEVGIGTVFTVTLPIKYKDSYNKTEKSHDKGVSR
jgi:signal transduction histidine kinase